jgi:nicotinamide mononucleotide transporter
MPLLDLIALIFGALGVYLTIKQTVWCWPISLVGVAASLAAFINQKLFGDSFLQVFYFFAGVYGWVYWQKQLNKTFTVTRMPLQLIPMLLLVTVVLTCIFIPLLTYFGGDKVIFDSILTALSLTATYMMTKKWLQNWIAWVLIDFAYIILYEIKGMHLFALLYLLFTLMAVYGYLQWKKIALKK